MPLGKRVDTRLDREAEERRQRAKLRISYGNRSSNLNAERLQRHAAAAAAALTAKTTTPLRRIASSYAHVSDVSCGSCAALPHADNAEDAGEERAETLIRSESFQTPGTPGTTTTTATTTAAAAAAARPIETATTSRAPLSASASPSAPLTERRNHYLCGNVMKSRATERWSQIACTVSALFRVRRIPSADPFSELRRLREQRDLLEAFTRPFLYDDVQPK